jgi:hypothetical protein
MVQRKFITLSILAILVSVTYLSITNPTCDANYANWGIMFEGSTYHNGTHISMPYADVRINITGTATAIIVSLDSEFHIVTNTTQNTTLAFVYPTAWSDDALLSNPPPTWGDGTTNKSYFMHIYGNGTLIDYTVIHYNDTVEGGFIEHFISDIPILQDVDFAIFDRELIANTTLILSTVSGSIFSPSMDRFDYSYIVGSARTFESHTMERVQMHTVEEVPFLSKSFSPNEPLTVVDNGIETDAIWDLNITEFQLDQVSFGANIYAYVAWLPTILWSSVIVIIVFLLIYRRLSKIANE